MRDYFKRFGMMLVLVVAMLAVIGCGFWVFMQAIAFGGFLGGMGVVVVIACAIAAAMPDSGAPF